MAQPRFENVAGHWSKLIENLQASPKDFYTAVEAALERRQLPNYKTSRVEFGEFGALSAKRLYLRVTRGRLHFDLCAAPFGTGSFFSWWLAKRKPRFPLLWGIVLVVGAVVVAQMLLRSIPVQIGPQELWILGVLGVIVAVVGLGLIAMVSEFGLDGPEGAIQAIPLLGAWYTRVFRPETYYSVDTTSMFQTSVHAAVLEVIDGLTNEKGFRALEPDDRKPILRSFL